ncbi:MAG: MFS transporter [Chloroflexota bacterium]
MSAGGRFRALYIRNYRLFFLGQLVSLSGTWMQRVAQAWLVLQLTDSPFALGTVSAIQFAPILVLMPFGGVLADRFPKQRVMSITQVLQMIQAITLATLVTTGIVELWHVYALAAMLGLSNAFDNPTRHSMTAELVGQENLANAVALNSSLMNTARIIGPAIAGIIIARFGINACFWANALSFVATLGALAAMRKSEMLSSPAARKGHVLGQIGEGMAFAASNRSVCQSMILVGALGTFGFNFNTFVPLIARYVVGSGAAGFGFLFSCLGAGSVLSALTVASRREATERTLMIGAAAFALTLAMIAASPLYALTAGLLFVLGAASTAFSTTASTRVQLATPASMRGRVMSLHMMLFMGTTPIGATFIGSISEWFDVPTALASCAGMCLLGVVAAAVYAVRVPAPVESPG